MTGNILEREATRALISKYNYSAEQVDAWLEENMSALEFHINETLDVFLEHTAEDNHEHEN